MNKNDAKNALLVGSYISTSQLGSASIVPEFVAPDLTPLELNEAAQELISQGLITLPDKNIAGSTTRIDPFRCRYEITPKGKGVLDGLASGLHRNSELGLFKIIIATRGSTVHYHEERNQILNVVTFEQSMIKQIENSTASDQEKQDAKSKLKEFLAHPLLSTVLGGALDMALKMQG